MKTIVLLLLLLSSIQAHADVFDMTDHSGIIKDSSGNYYKVNSQGTISAIKTGTSLAVTEKINIPTSKGSFATDLVRTAPIDIARVGASVASIAKLAGPIGLTLTAIDLVCSLSSICNVNGSWETYTSPSPLDSLHSSIGWSINGNYYTTKTLSQAQRLHAPCTSDTGPGACIIKDEVITDTGNGFPAVNYKVFYPSNSSYFLATANKIGAAYSPPTATHAPTTAQDWDSKQSLLNDVRFADSFLEKGNPVPVGNPTITNPINVPLGSETMTTKDGAGNVTGTQTTTKTAQISQPSSAENPTNSPSLIKITENTTINNYNTSNQLTSSTSTVTNNPVPVQEPQKQEPITISIDNVPDQALQTYAVPGTFSFTSWGSGSCPSDKSWSTMFGTHSFSYELTCDFATTFRPILLAIAAIVSFMIVASTRTE